MAEPGRGVSRRRALELLAAGAMVGCDRVVLDPGPGPDTIPPITPTPDFYVYQHGFLPEVDPSTWTCALVQRGSPITTLDAAFFDSLTPVELEHTLQCIGSNPRSPQIGNAVWGGLPFDELLDGLGASVDPAVVEVLFEAADGYHTSIPVADLLEGRIWLVWRMNGEALTAEHGAPCRFLVQGRYGTKNVKWPVRVELIDAPHEGYWESRGWSADATYRQNGFVFAPRDGSTVIGTVNLVGTAYAGSDPVVRVEVSFNEGDSWDDAELVYAPGPDVWVLWRYVLEGASGRMQARIRVTTAGGLVSGDPNGSSPYDGYDGGMSVSFDVEPVGVILVAAALAGPWTRDAGDAYLKLAGDVYAASRYVLPEELPGAGSQEFGAKGIFAQQVGLYAEVGVSDGHPIQLAVKVPFVASSVRFAEVSSAGSFSGRALASRFGDLEFGPQIALSRKHPIAARLWWKVPLYSVDGICDQSVFRDYCGRPGDGQTDLTGWLTAGSSFAGGRVWVEGELGYRHRTEIFRAWTTDRTFVDGVAYGVAVGGRIGPAIGMLRADGVRNLRADPWTADGMRVGPSAMIEVGGGFALEARLAVDLLVRNGTSGLGGGLGVSWRRRP